MIAFCVICGLFITLVFGVGIGRYVSHSDYRVHLKRHILQLTYFRGCKFCEIEKQVDLESDSPLQNGNGVGMRVWFKAKPAADMCSVSCVCDKCLDVRRAANQAAMGASGGGRAH